MAVGLALTQPHALRWTASHSPEFAAHRYREYVAGEYILEKGAAADALYLILSGEVSCHYGVGFCSLLLLGSLFGIAI